MTHRHRAAVTLFIVLAIGLLTGCSTFERDWDSGATIPEAPKGVEGRWSGTWLSHSNGHTGDLRAIIAPNEDGVLVARYHATYGWGLEFEYDVPMTVTREGDIFRFAAEANLGWLAGGVYTYEGTVVGDQFSSTYDSKADRGVFSMERLAEDTPVAGDTSAP